MATAAAPPDEDGWCSLSLHAGGTIPELQGRRSGSRPHVDRRGIAEVSAHVRTATGVPPRAARRRNRRTRADRERTHGICRLSSLTRPTSRSRCTQRSTSSTARRCRPASGPCPRRSPSSSPQARRRLRHPHRDVQRRLDEAAPGRQGHEPQGLLRRRLGVHLRDSVRRELYDWLDGNEEVAFLPVDQVNDPTS